MASMATGTADATDTRRRPGPRRPPGPRAGCRSASVRGSRRRCSSSSPCVCSRVARWASRTTATATASSAAPASPRLTLDGYASWQRRLDRRLRGRPADLPGPGALVGAGDRPGDDLVSGGTWSPTALGWTYAVLVGLVVGLARGRRRRRGRRRALAVAVPGAPAGGRDVPPVLRLHLQRARGPARLRHHGRRRRRRARHPPRAPRRTGGRARARRRPAGWWRPRRRSPTSRCSAPRCWCARSTRSGSAAPAGSGPRSPLVTALLAVAPVLAAVERQQQFYAPVNAHNLVFTTILLELGSDGDERRWGCPPRPRR